MITLHICIIPISFPLHKTHSTSYQNINSEIQISIQLLANYNLIIEVYTSV